MYQRTTISFWHHRANTSQKDLKCSFATAECRTVKPWRDMDSAWAQTSTTICISNWDLNRAILNSNTDTISSKSSSQLTTKKTSIPRNSICKRWTMISRLTSSHDISEFIIRSLIQRYWSLSKSWPSTSKTMTFPASLKVDRLVWSISVWKSSRTFTKSFWSLSQPRSMRTWIFSVSREKTFPSGSTSPFSTGLSKNVFWSTR